MTRKELDKAWEELDKKWKQLDKDWDRAEKTIFLTWIVGGPLAIASLFLMGWIFNIF